MDAEERPRGEVEVVRGGQARGGDERPAVHAEDPDVADLRQARVDLREGPVERRLPRPDRLVGGLAQGLVDLPRHEVGGLEHLDRVLAHHVEGARQTALGLAPVAAVGQPGRGGEDEERQAQGRDHDEPQRPLGGRSGGAPRRVGGDWAGWRHGDGIAWAGAVAYQRP
ncbi:MAG: hypothetical protein K2X71_20225 [Methylobacterium sp.]|nr:hypothetical protein [Methylobacterium sp.]